MTGLHWRNFQEYHQDIGDSEGFKIIKIFKISINQKINKIFKAAQEGSDKKASE